MSLNLCGHKLPHFNYSRKVIFTKQNDVKLIYLANKNIIYFKTLIKNVQQKNFAT